MFGHTENWKHWIRTDEVGIRVWISRKKLNVKEKKMVLIQRCNVEKDCSYCFFSFSKLKMFHNRYPAPFYPKIDHTTVNVGTVVFKLSGNDTLSKSCHFRYRCFIHNIGDEREELSTKRSNILFNCQQTHVRRKKKQLKLICVCIMYSR